MMYKRVGEAIREAGISSHPTDWLLFLCPGKRELPGPHIDQLEAPVEPLAQVRKEVAVLVLVIFLISNISFSC
jgi:hypothetical protein